MKYDAQISPIQSVLSGANGVLIALTNQPTFDQLAAALTFHLSLEQAGKKSTVVTEGTIKVEHANLFGIDKVQHQLPQGGEGNLIITLGGVVDSASQTVPSLQRLDWRPSGNDLELVFHTQPGQKFEPTSVTHKKEGSSTDVIITIGATNLNLLGSLYLNNQTTFAGKQIINIDNQAGNGQYGSINLVDPTASSLSEIIALLIPALKFPFNQDIATNALAGIFLATNNLQGTNVTGDTFMVVGQALQAGGVKPNINPQSVSPTDQAFAQAFTQPGISATPTTPGNLSQPVVASPVTPNQPTAPSSNLANNPYLAGGQMPDLSKIFGTQINSTAPTAPQQTPMQSTPATSSPETAPATSLGQPPSEDSEEEVVTPEDDWLTPKIYKGSSVS